MAYIELGSTPCDEQCAQVGCEDYAEKSVEEIKRYIKQLNELLVSKFGEMSGLVYISKKSFNHDFGSYSEAVVYYNENDEEAVEMAFWLEENLPANWSEDGNLGT